MRIQSRLLPSPLFFLLKISSISILFIPKDIPSVVEEYLEQCSQAGLKEVRIIHGRGTGVQRNIVRSILQRHPLVLSFRDAPPEAGGWGAAFVLLNISKTLKDK